MHDLRLIGVHADGVHLLLVDESGERFRVPIDEALRAAARRDRPRLGQLQIEDNPVRPKDIQQMIRQGMTAEEVAARTGWPLEKVVRYEGPVVAEREFYASRAQRVGLRTAGSRSHTETLLERVESRLQERGVESDLVHWDAARAPDGHWTVSVEFTAGGRNRRGSWYFDTQALTVVPRDDEARWLTEEIEEGVIPSPHAVRPDAPVFDVEASGGVRDRSPRPDLVTTMKAHSGARSRRGRRRDPATGATTGPEGAAASDATRSAEPSDDRETPEPGAQTEVLEVVPADTPPEVPQDDATTSDEAPDDAAPVESAPVDSTAQDSPKDSPAQGPAAQPARPKPGPPGPRKAPSGGKRKGRPSVPSWDDVMFGGGGGTRSG